MNIIKKISILILSAVTLVSCSHKEEPIVYLDVNAHNISGSWKLVEWNGTELDASTYMYVNFVRNDRTFTIYQNMDSFTDVPHVATGSFFIETDVELGAIIRGAYDFGQGDWEHRYYVRNLTNERMEWVATDNENVVMVYIRAELPEWIESEE